MAYADRFEDTLPSQVGQLMVNFGLGTLNIEGHTLNPKP